jgi:hypothetical protein
MQITMSLANPILVFISSFALLLIGCAIGMHYSKSTSLSVWIAVCGGLLMVIHDLLQGLLWLGITARWMKTVKDQSQAP